MDDDDLVSIGDDDEDYMMDSSVKKKPSDGQPKKKSSKKLLNPKELLLDMLTKIKIKDRMGVFSNKVDKHTVPDYRKVIRTPMYFNKIETKINKGKYRDVESFAKDVKLLIDNATKYNGASSPIGKCAVSVEKHLQRLMSTAPQRWQASEEDARAKGIPMEMWLRQAINLPANQPLPPAKVEHPRDPENWAPDSDSDESLPPPEQDEDDDVKPVALNKPGGASATGGADGDKAAAAKKTGPVIPDALPNLKNSDRTVLKRLVPSVVRRQPATLHAALALFRQRAYKLALEDMMKRQAAGEDVNAPPPPGSKPLELSPLNDNESSSSVLATELLDWRLFIAHTATGVTQAVDSAKLTATVANVHCAARPLPCSVTAGGEASKWDNRGRPVGASDEESVRAFLQSPDFLTGKRPQALGDVVKPEPGVAEEPIKREGPWERKGQQDWEEFVQAALQARREKLQKLA